MVRVTRYRIRLLVAVVALCLAAPSVVLAQDFDAIDQADVLQKQALKAAREGNWKVARQLAEEVLILDVSFATAPSRIVLARALQKEDNYAGALYELRQLERLDGVEDRFLEDGAALRAEVESQQARAQRQAERKAAPAVPERSVGIGLIAGGVAPVVVGGLFVGSDVHYASQGTESGTWAVMGAPILATGIVLEVVGAALVAKGGKTPKTAFRLDGVAFGMDSEQVWLGVSGRF